MKTLKTLFATAIIASITLAGTVQADQLMDTIHPESADLFDHSTGINTGSQTDIVSLGDTSDTQVWSVEYEQYVDPADFTANSYADINNYMDANPTAAGGLSNEVFIENPIDGDYHLN